MIFMRKTFFAVVAATLITTASACQKGTEEEPRPDSSTAENTKELTRAEIRMLEKAAGEDTAAVKELLDLGVDVNMRGKDNNTPIMEAAFSGRLETVKLLLDHGADLSAKKNDGETVVSLGGGHKEIVELFEDVSSLVQAAAKGDGKQIEELVAKGTPVNGLDQTGRSALTAAAGNGHTETARLLLDSGADPTIKNSDDQTPLSLAQSQNHQQVVALLEAAIAKRRPDPF
jgi:ankyrin repeat protein